MTPHPRRKKWTEAEERTLIEKYGEMVCDGSLSKMKTREKKYKPVALHVNSMHHVRDPVLYPWQWTWKDVSTKVQNMRHQYALVKQKIKKQESSLGGDAEEEFDWIEGNTHWLNFLRYKDVFGDVPLLFSGNDEVGWRNEHNERFGGGGHELDIIQFGPLGPMVDGDFVGGIDGVENGVMELEFDYDEGEGEGEGEENYIGGNRKVVCGREDVQARFVCEDHEPSSSDMRKKRKVLKGMDKKAWTFLVNQLQHLREMEARLEKREVERERERKRRENLRIEMEKEREMKWAEMEKEREAGENTRENLRRQWLQQWETMERENKETGKVRREEELKHEREWEERLKRKRSDWKKRMDEMLSQHRAEIDQVQARILHEQQNITNQFIGVVSQWTCHPTGISDHNGASSHYLSQMIQNLHHVNSLVHGDSRDGGDNQEDQFIVDG